jgi:crotonobetainyl-CoA:carnitine CoA-transferase CaiB-like acyl-CoA transferase
MAVLSGVRILAVEQYGAGPFGTQALADLGAEVIKIENPRDGGDVTRSLGPFFDEKLGRDAESLFFQALNCNKKSVALDLGCPEGQAVFHKLVADADAVACNLRGDVPDKLGLTYATLGRFKPQIVCCHLTAYGRDGSRASWPGYDYLIQAESGYFYLNGEPESPPSRFGLSIIDYATGYCMALSLVAGVLSARETGKGRDLDVSLFDVGLANLCYLALWNLNRGFQPDRVPRSGHPTLAPCQLFPTSDGWIYIMANKEKFFPPLCAKLGRPELAKDPRFATFADRLANRSLLTEVLDPMFRARSTAEWLEELAGLIPAAPVLDMNEALAAPFISERGSIVTVESESGAQIRLIGSPFRTGDTRPNVSAPPLGRHTDEILVEAGYSQVSIDKLRGEGIVR